MSNPRQPVLDQGFAELIEYRKALCTARPRTARGWATASWFDARDSCERHLQGSEA